jgi:hypothetical protein
MLAVVFVALAGLRSVRLRFFERWAHAAAGVAVLACGVAVKFLGI